LVCACLEFARSRDLLECERARLHLHDLLEQRNVICVDSGEAKKLRQLEDENRKLKHVVADLTFDNRALKDVLSKNW
jgi:putative transposase